MKEKTKTTINIKNDKKTKADKKITKKSTTNKLDKEKTIVKKANTKKTTSTTAVKKDNSKKSSAKKTTVNKIDTKEAIESKVDNISAIKDEIKVVEDTNIQKEIDIDNNVKGNKKRKFNIFALISIILAILCIYLISKLNNNNVTNQHKLQELCVNCFDETATYTLPENWKIAEDGSLFLDDNNVLVIKGGLYAYEDSEENFNLMIESLKSSYEVEETALNEFKVAKVIEEYPEQKVSYYFVYKNNRSFQLVLINEDENVSNIIINSFKY